MLTERDIENLLNSNDRDSLAWERRSDPPMPEAKCWSSTDEKWLIQYISDTTDPGLAIGRSVGGDHVFTSIAGIGDRAASKLLRAAAIDPGATMEMLHERVDGGKTQFCCSPY